MELETLTMRVEMLEKRIDDMVMERRKETDRISAIDIHRYQVSKDIENMVKSQEGLCQRLKVLQGVVYTVSATVSTIVVVGGGLLAYLKPYIAITVTGIK